MTRQPDAASHRGHFRLAGDFADGAPFLNGVPVSEIIPMAGAVRSRFRFKTSGAGGVLSFRFVRPDGTDTPYTGMQPVDLAVVAGTEAVQDIDRHYGEGLLNVTFTPGGNGNVTYADVSQV